VDRDMRLLSLIFLMSTCGHIEVVGTRAVPTLKPTSPAPSFLLTPPTPEPSPDPTPEPTSLPSPAPSNASLVPSASPTLEASSSVPSCQPSPEPSSPPSLAPSRNPSPQPSCLPSPEPSSPPPSPQPSCLPSIEPSSDSNILTKIRSTLSFTVEGITLAQAESDAFLAVISIAISDAATPKLDSTYISAVAASASSSFSPFSSFAFAFAFVPAQVPSGVAAVYFHATIIVPPDIFHSVLTISQASLNSALQAILALNPVPGLSPGGVSVTEASIKSEASNAEPGSTAPSFPLGSVVAAVVLSVVGGVLLVALGHRCCSAPRVTSATTFKAREEEEEQAEEQTGLKEG